MPKIPSKINKVIDEVVNGINKILSGRIKKIILYGSYARGDYNKNSDIDIMILTDLSDEEIVKYRVKIWDFVYDIELENDIIISPVIKNIDNFNYWSDTMPFYMNVQKEGVVLNGW